MRETPINEEVKYRLGIETRDFCSHSGIVLAAALPISGALFACLLALIKWGEWSPTYDVFLWFLGSSIVTFFACYYAFRYQMRSRLYALVDASRKIEYFERQSIPLPLSTRPGLERRIAVLQQQLDDLEE